MILAPMLLALDGGSAEACSCPAEVGTLPGGGDPAVPTNLRAVYFWGYGDDAYLVADDGTEHHGQVEVTPRIRVLRLTSELRPNTVYTMVFSQKAWNRPPVTFTTDSRPDREMPPSPVFKDFQIEWLGRDDRDTCGPDDYRIHGYLAAPPGTDIKTMGMRFTSSTGEARHTYLYPESGIDLATGQQVWSPSQLGTTYCANRFTLEKGETYLVEAWSIDGAGNTSEPVADTFTLDAGGCSTGGGQAAGGLVPLVLAGVLRRHRRLARA